MTNMIMNKKSNITNSKVRAFGPYFFYNKGENLSYGKNERTRTGRIRTESGAQ